MLHAHIMIVTALLQVMCPDAVYVKEYKLTTQQLQHASFPIMKAKMWAQLMKAVLKPGACSSVWSYWHMSDMHRIDQNDLHA